MLMSSANHKDANSQAQQVVTMPVQKSIAVCEKSIVHNIIFFFQAEDGIRDYKVTGVQTCALPIYPWQSGIPECDCSELVYKIVTACRKNTFPPTCLRGNKRIKLPRSLIQMKLMNLDGIKPWLPRNSIDATLENWRNRL